MPNEPNRGAAEIQNQNSEQVPLEIKNVPELNSLILRGSLVSYPVFPDNSGALPINALDHQQA
jgi:hypothetical protein